MPSGFSCWPSWMPISPESESPPIQSRNGAAWLSARGGASALIFFTCDFEFSATVVVGADFPVASEFEHADRYPDAIVETMKSLGLFGVTIPEEYGGLGLDLLTYIGVVEELSYGWMSLSGVVNTHTIAASIIVANGTEEQKHRWLPRLATGELRGCLSLSEADAGSDTRNVSCRAERDGDEYVISGTKMWVTNGERAGIGALAARTDEGISSFIVEKDTGPASGTILVSRYSSNIGVKVNAIVCTDSYGHRAPAEYY